MSKPIESAEKFAARLNDECEIGSQYEPLWDADTAVPLIEARDKAIRLALLDELIALDDGMELTITVYQEVREMRARYVDKP